MQSRGSLNSSNSHVSIKSKKSWFSRRGSAETTNSGSTMIGSIRSFYSKEKSQQNPLGSDVGMTRDGLGLTEAMGRALGDDELDTQGTPDLRGRRPGGVSTFNTIASLMDTRRNSYQDIALAAFGTLGHYFALAIVGVNLFGCGVLYTILSATLIGDMIKIYAQVNVSTVLLVFASSVVVWACLIFTKTMKEVALLSILGASATIGVVCITVGIAADELIRQTAEVIGSSHRMADWSKIPISLATISFAPILQNLPQGAWSILANSLITLHVLLATPIMLTSLAMMTEESITNRWPQFEQGSERQQFLKRGVVRTMIVFLVGLVAAVIPFFGDVMDLLGSLTVCLLVFILPILFYYRLGGFKSARWTTRAFAVLILAIGVMASVLGTMDAMRHLIFVVRRHK
ncbi:hypothetical protein BGZ94_010174 [Podila epigama]|nr:hypothetical protein BGZ94_010174 [Podila epigama]